MPSITAGLSTLVTDVLILLAAPTVLMLLVRRFVPYAGEQLWRSYCRVLGWLFRAPFRLVRLLIREVTARNRLRGR